MSEFKGTPGPWEWTESLISQEVLLRGKEGEKVISNIVTQPSRGHGYSNPAKYVNEPNARLIAAAPELLEALQKLCVYAEDVCGVCPDDCHEGHPLMSAHAAIAKALGETK